MAYSTIDDILSRLSEYGATAYLDRDGDGVLNAAEKQVGTDSITVVDSLIDARLAAAGLKVLTAGTIIKRISNTMATAEVCTQLGQHSATALAVARHWSDVLDLICSHKLRPGTEVGPATQRNPGPIVSNPRVQPPTLIDGGGVSWPEDKKTRP